MASFYLDVSAVGNEYQAYAATPTWGALSTDKPLPMDGNGSAGPGHSAAVAVAELQITVLPADANTLVIAGALLTAKTTAAAKNQWTIGADIATCAANLVALVNTAGTGTSQCDAATSTTACALALSLPYWQFARVKPGTTDTIQFATRIAGADLNYATNSAVAISSSGWGTPPTITQFAGGANGPFAYFTNPTTIFGKTIGTYGPLSAKTAGPTDPGAAADIIHGRTKRSGVNLSLTLTRTGGTLNLINPTGANRNFLFDDGTIWTGDNGVFTAALNTGDNSSYLNFGANSSTTFRLAARSLYGVKITHQSNNGAGFSLSLNVPSNSVSEYFRVAFEEMTAISTINVCTLGSNGSMYSALECKVIYRSSHGIPSSLNSNTYSVTIRFSNSIFEWVGIGANVTGILPLTAGFTSQAPKSTIEFLNCKFIVDGGAYSVTGAMSGASNLVGNSYVSFSFSNCSGLSNPSAGIPASTAYGNPSFLWDGSDNGRSFRYETMNYTLDWIDGGTYPYYNTQVASGAYMSHRLTWETARLSSGVKLSVGRYGAWFKDTSAAKVVTLELLVPTAEIPTRAQLGMSVKYTGSDGNIYYEHSIEPYLFHSIGIATVLSDGVGVGSWTLNGVTGVSSKKLAVTTTNAVQQNTEITAELILVGPPASNRAIYINPDLVLS